MGDKALLTLILLALGSTVSKYLMNTLSESVSQLGVTKDAPQIQFDDQQVDGSEPIFYTIFNGVEESIVDQRGMATAETATGITAITARSPDGIRVSKSANISRLNEYIMFEDLPEANWQEVPVVNSLGVPARFDLVNGFNPEEMYFVPLPWMFPYVPKWRVSPVLLRSIRDWLTFVGSVFNTRGRVLNYTASNPVDDLAWMIDFTDYPCRRSLYAPPAFEERWWAAYLGAPQPLEPIYLGRDSIMFDGTATSYNRLVSEGNPTITLGSRNYTPIRKPGILGLGLDVRISFIDHYIHEPQPYVELRVKLSVTQNISSRSYTVTSGTGNPYGPYVDHTPNND